MIDERVEQRLLKSQIIMVKIVVFPRQRHIVLNRKVMFRQITEIKRNQVGHSWREEGERANGCHEIWAYSEARHTGGDQLRDGDVLFESLESAESSTNVPIAYLAIVVDECMIRQRIQSRARRANVSWTRGLVSMSSRRRTRACA